jgi:hypothetical protein
MFSKLKSKVTNKYNEQYNKHITNTIGSVPCVTKKCKQNRTDEKNKAIMNNNKKLMDNQTPNTPTSNSVTASYYNSGIINTYNNSNCNSYLNKAPTTTAHKSAMANTQSMMTNGYINIPPIKTKNYVCEHFNSNKLNKTNKKLYILRIISILFFIICIIIYLYYFILDFYNKVKKKY